MSVNSSSQFSLVDFGPNSVHTCAYVYIYIYLYYLIVYSFIYTCTPLRTNVIMYIFMYWYIQYIDVCFHTNARCMYTYLYTYMKVITATKHKSQPRCLHACNIQVWMFWDLKQFLKWTGWSSKFVCPLPGSAGEGNLSDRLLKPFDTKLHTDAQNNMQK